MYKLVFLIFSLSVFLIYKGFTLNISKSPKHKKKIIFVNDKPKAAKANKPSQNFHKIETKMATEAPPPVKNPQPKFDSLADMYKDEQDYVVEAVPIEAGKLTSVEREEYEKTLQQMKYIEDHADLKIEASPAVRYDKLTPEQKKAFEDYQKFTNSNKGSNQ